MAQPVPMQQPGAVMAQPVPMQQPGMVMAQPVQPNPMVGGVPMQNVPVAKYAWTVGGTFAPLANVNNVRFTQGNIFWEAVTGGCVPNTYMITDTDTDNAIL